MSFHRPPLRPGTQWILNWLFVLSVGYVVMWEMGPYVPDLVAQLMGVMLFGMILIMLAGLGR